MSQDSRHSDRWLERLPLVTLYLSERCNSRCITCDYWRHGRADMTLERVAKLAPSLRALGTRVVLISGGEPLLNREWRRIAGFLREQGLYLWLLTSGLSLAKHARAVAQLFDRITVSLDGARRETYAAIRGVDAFEHVLAGVCAAIAAGAPASLRVTLQRGNFRELPEFIELAHSSGASEISFLAVDVANPHAFARREPTLPDVALRPEELPELARILDALIRSRAPDFQSGFIAETPEKLLRIFRYFTAVCGLGRYPPVRCNAPEFSAVIDAQGRVQPCFFIPGPPGELLGDGPSPPDLPSMLNGTSMRALRTDIRSGRRPECSTCVCSMWRDLDGADAGVFAGQVAPRRRGVPAPVE
ncbi:MAG TPA: radical SAM/SPASM domain-containing protein [Steroidobacteraceae bacterium]|nr:radical SAM/SPASM domain-containing protein [Steroidobacteraceae bacterium]